MEAAHAGLFVAISSKVKKPWIAFAKPYSRDSLGLSSGPSKIGDYMRITLSGVMVDDQDKALRFYTDILGFAKKSDIPMGEFRWLTVASPEGVDGVELALEPAAFPPSKIFQRALFDAGIPLTAFPTKEPLAKSIETITIIYVLKRGVRA